MRRFKSWLFEAQNTLAADANETVLGLFILNGPMADINKARWYDSAAKAQFYKRLKELSPEDAETAIEQARVMAEAFINAAKSMGYSGVSNVYWTARAGSMAAAVGEPVDQSKNPTDVLVKFRTGPANGFLGLSAKATKGKGDIGFKNKGVGTVDKELGIELEKIQKTEEAKILTKLKVPEMPAAKKKEWIRANPKIAALVDASSAQIYGKIRDALLTRLLSMKKDDLYKYIINAWMDADIVYPPYLKVTGHGNSKSKSYSASVMNPIDNPKLKALATRNISLQPAGEGAIVVSVGGMKIMKMRAKYVSQKLSSSMKFSGEPA
jgi:hypothetical protein